MFIARDMPKGPRSSGAQCVTDHVSGVCSSTGSKTYSFIALAYREYNSLSQESRGQLAPTGIFISFLSNEGGAPYNP